MVVLVHRRLWPYIVSRSLFRIGSQLADSFVPFLLMLHGLSLQQLLIYNTIYAIVGIPTVWLAGRIIRRYGARTCLGIAYGFYMAFFVALFLFVSGPATGWWLVTIMGIAMGIFSSLSGPAAIFQVSQAMDKDNPGRDSSFLQIVFQLSNAAGPILGTFVAVQWGGRWLVLCAAVFLFASLGSLRYIEVGRRSQTKLKRALRTASWRELVGAFSIQVHGDVGTALWPVFLAVVAPAFKVIGPLAAVAAICMAATSWFVGNGRIDKNHRYKVLVVTSGLIAIVNLARLLPHSLAMLTGITIVYGIVFTSFAVSWNAAYFSRARQLEAESSRGVAYVIAREGIGAVGNLALWGGMLLLSLAHWSDLAVLRAGFGCGAIAVWGCLAHRT